MKPTFLLALLTPSWIAAATENPVHPTVDSIGMFKNGLAVVRVSFPIDGPGPYRWDEVPRVVHGSLWVESEGKVGIRSTTRSVETTEPTENPSGVLQRDLAGKQVTATLRSGHGPETTVSGRVWEIPPATVNRTWEADYSSLNPGGGFHRWNISPSNGSRPAPTPPTTGGFLVLEEAAGGRRYLDHSSIAMLTVGGPFGPATRHEDRPVLIFDVGGSPPPGARVRITYLTKGLAWLPSYRLDLDDPGTLRIRQNAVIRNEMADFSDTELQLISGFPNVRFGAVDSPVWPGTGLAAFFQQVNQSAQPPAGVLGNGIMSQQAVYLNSAGQGGFPALPELAEPGNASDDIHYETIGRQSLKAGDSLSMDIAAASAEYQRVVEWTVPDPRDERGRYRSGEKAPEEAWDAVKFANPFKFPMTTGAAMILEGGRFRGQSQSDWVNPGQQTCLRVTRALSVRTESGEIEEEGQREIVYIAGNDYQRTSVKGRLAVRNFRNQAITLTLRGEFSGELLEAEGDPAKSLRTEGVSSVNPRRRLDWTIQLPAGQEKVLTYRYRVLVDR